MTSPFHAMRKFGFPLYFAGLAAINSAFFFLQGSILSLVVAAFLFLATIWSLWGVTRRRAGVVTTTVVAPVPPLGSIPPQPFGLRPSGPLGFQAGYSPMPSFSRRPGPPGPHELWGQVPPAPTSEPRAIVGIIGYRYIDTAVPDIAAFCKHGGPHAVPAWDCSCGYYAVVSLAFFLGEELKRLNDRYTLRHLGIQKVEAIGRVIIHEDGWRAERIRKVE